MGLYLESIDTKQQILAEFAILRKQPVPENLNLGGRGYPDQEILPFCDWLNTFDGVYTMQSCAGHLSREGHVQSQGILWV